MNKEILSALSNGTRVTLNGESYGILSLFDMPFETLNKIYIELAGRLDEDKKSSVLEDDEDLQLQEGCVKLVKLVIVNRKEIEDERRAKEKNERHNQRIRAIIKRKREQELEALSIEELEKQIIK